MGPRTLGLPLAHVDDLSRIRNSRGGRVAVRDVRPRRAAHGTKLFGTKAGTPAMADAVPQITDERSEPHMTLSNGHAFVLNRRAGCANQPL